VARPSRYDSWPSNGKRACSYHIYTVIYRSLYSIYEHNWEWCFQVNRVVAYPQDLCSAALSFEQDSEGTPGPLGTIYQAGQILSILTPSIEVNLTSPWRQRASTWCLHHQLIYIPRTGLCNHAHSSILTTFYEPRPNRSMTCTTSTLVDLASLDWRTGGINWK